MIPPLTAEEFKTMVPEWAQKLTQQRCPIVKGLPVYDVLYGSKYSTIKCHGIVEEFFPCDERCALTRDHGLSGHVLVKYPGGSSSGLAAYWVPDMETKEGRLHVEKWESGKI